MTPCEGASVTTDLDELGSLFADKLRTEGKLVEPAARGARNLLVEYHGQHLTLVLPERALSRMLAEGDELAAISRDRPSRLTNSSQINMVRG